MARLTISLPEELATAAATVAATQKRSASSYVALLIEDDLRRVGALGFGEPTAALAEFMAKATPAIAANPAVLTKLEETLRKSQRHKKAAA
jgi:hypothetical protein